MMTAFQPANEQLGYFFHTPAQANELGSPQLDVVLRPTPSGEHFDPVSFMCQTTAPTGLTKLRVTHPWEQEKSYRINAGEIIIEDARLAQVKAFTFGGSLQIDSDARRTLCRLASPAPLLEHSLHEHSLEERMIEEVYILFAQRRAAQDDDDFESKLANVDPVLLYRACLKALADKFEHFPATDEAQGRFRQFLHNTTAAWQDETIPALADLL